MKEIIERLTNEYGSAKNEPFANHPFGNFVRSDIPKILYSTGLVDQYEYLVTASVGQGNWATIPWICIFDRSVTTTATKGVYIVYLLSKDCSKLYLTFNQGCTDIRKNHSKKETIAIMRDNADKIINVIDSRGFRTDEDIDLGDGITELGQLYQKGTIFYKEYRKDSIPDEDTLRNDLTKMMEIYAEYIAKFQDASKWWPTLEEYDPGITKDQWIELLTNPEIIGPVWGGTLAMFYAQDGAATCSELAAIYNRDPSGLSGNCTQLAMRIYKETKCPLFIEDGEEKYWPILFVGKKQIKGEPGNWIWKLRSELYDAISESDILKYLPKSKKQSWLLTWNPSYYDWTDYYEGRDQIRNEDSYSMDWACQSKKVEIGDRVYMMMLGCGDQNGIVVSGIVTKAGYEAEHWDPKKAAEGKTCNTIDFDIDCMLDYKNGNILKQSVLKEKFPNQQWSPMSTGISIKDEYIDALEEEWKKYQESENEKTPENEGKRVMDISEKEALDQIKNYIFSKGFSYGSGLIENFYLSLKSKPFVILAGTSGTGKTRLVRLFAEAIDAEYKMVPVRPDWSDSSDLFGHLDLNGNYIAGEIIEFIADAQRNPGIPYILCLDEMNLARVEYYLSDFLSVIETRDLIGDQIVSDPLVSLNKYGTDEDALLKYGELRFPQNLYLVGTVNMDETTFPFSKKVLDRANTIEFNYVDLLPDEDETGEAKRLQLPNSFLKTKYLLLMQCKSEAEFVREISGELQSINEVLQKANCHVGYRVRDEIVFYMLNNKETGLLERNDAFDNEIMQKVLPRIQGSSVSVKNMLCELFKMFAGDYTGYSSGASGIADNMLDKLRKENAKYPKSAEKIAFMVRRFEEDGFTSYWL